MQRLVERGDLDPLVHHQGMSAATMTALYCLDIAVVVDLRHCYALKCWTMPTVGPRFILLENFMALEDWVLAPPDDMPKDVAWVEWVARPRRVEDDEDSWYI